MPESVSGNIVDINNYEDENEEIYASSGDEKDDSDNE